MATWLGRVEKRIPLEVTMQISDLQKSGFANVAEEATTENVSTHGARVLVRRALPPQEWLLVSSLIRSEAPISAQVVYCQRLAEGVFGVGLQFEKSEATAGRKTRPSLFDRVLAFTITDLVWRNPCSA